jgi:PAS domain S-box-containing protein
MSILKRSRYLPCGLLAGSVLLALLVGGAGYYHHHLQLQRQEFARKMSLAGIASEKANFVSAWRDQLHQEGRRLAGDRTLRRLSRAYFRNRRNAKNVTDITIWLEALANSHHFRGAGILDRSGKTVLAAGKEFPAEDHAEAESGKAFAKRDVHLAELHSAAGGKPRIAMIAPLFDEQGARAPIGALLINIDPEGIFFPLAHQHSRLSKSLETILVGTVNGERLYLTRPRFWPEGFLRRINARDLDRVRSLEAGSGATRVFEDTDYRGTPVIAAVCRAPGTSWHVIAKVDRAEVLAPIHRGTTLMLVISTLLIVAAGGLVTALCHRRDISLNRERNQAENRARDMAVRYNAFARQANDAFLVTDEEGNIVEANEKAFSTYGFTSSDYGAVKIQDLYPPGAGAELEEIRTLLSNSKGAISESLHKRSDGAVFPVEISAGTVEVDGAGYFQFIVRDTTERKEAQQLLRGEEQRFRKLYEEHNAVLLAIPDVVLLLDSGRKVLWANSVAARELGLDASQITGKSCDDVWHARIGAGHICPGRQCMATGVLEQSFGWTPDKKLYDIRAVPVRDTEGRIIRIVETGRNMTEFHRMEEQLRQSQKMETVGQLAGGIAHDFNNIITAIMGFAYILQMKVPDDSPERSCIANIISAAERAAALTGNLLSFSRKHTAVMKHIDLNEVARSMERLVTTLLDEDIELHIVPSKAPIVVCADGILLGQAILNLATNARDAMPGGGIVTIRTLLDPEPNTSGSSDQPPLTACLEIEDTGSGMDGETLERVFEPFFTTKESGKGTGLGLSIVQGIVRQHNGTVEVFSEKDKGTLIRVRLPLSTGVPIAGHPTQPFPLPGGNETLMLVEDDERIRKYLSELLSSNGYRVIDARDGSEALERFHAHVEEVELLVSDIVIPRKNGGELHRELLRIKPDLKTLFLSGYPTEALRKKGIDTDNMLIMSKPFAPREFLNTIRTLLD